VPPLYSFPLRRHHLPPITYEEIERWVSEFKDYMASGQKKALLRALGTNVTVLDKNRLKVKYSVFGNIFPEKELRANLVGSKILRSTSPSPLELPFDMETDQVTLTEIGTLTTFTDVGLDGNTEYRYTLVTRSTIGRDVASTPVGGKFHGFLREWPVPPQMTGGLAVDPEDRVSVSSTTPNQIVQFTNQGVLLRQFPIDPADPGQLGLSLAADWHGVYALVFLTSGLSYVQAYDPLGTPRFRWPPPGKESVLLGLAISPAGELWVAQLTPPAVTSTLYRLDNVTGVTVDTVVVQMPIPNGMAIGHQTGVAVIPFGEEVGIGIFDLTTGVVLRRIGGSAGSGKGQFSAPVAGVFGSDGRLFIVDGFNNRIQVFREGEYLTMWGQRGHAPGQFQFSGASPFGIPLTQVLAGIAVDTDGDIYVADTFSNRIQVFEP
jgi:hypothetical protein